jgi:hypothetical protein
MPLMRDEPAPPSKKTSESPNTPAAAPESIAAAKEQTLAEMDQSLAQELDQMMQGDSAAVNAVLEDVFREQAAVVQQLDESPKPVEPPLPMQAPALAAPLTAAAASPANVAVAKDVAPTLPAQTLAPEEVSSELASVAVTAVENVSARAEIEQPSPQVSDVRVEAQSLPPSGGDVNVRLRPGSLIQRLLGRVIDVLVLANYPLRKIPTSVRPAVDWIALSLLAWVPIVWVLAVMLGPKKTEGSAPSLEIPKMVLHEESTNAAEHD